MSEVVMVEVVVASDGVEIISAWLWDNGTDAVVETPASSQSGGTVALLAGLPAESTALLIASLPAEAAVALVAGNPAEAAATLVDSNHAGGDHDDGTRCDGNSGDRGDPMLTKVVSVRVVGNAIDDADAARSWRDHMELIDCGDLVIVPAWIDGIGQDAAPVGAVAEPGGVAAGPVGAEPGNDDRSDGRARGRVRLVMEPGDAFGAGTHVTTRLCAEVVGSLVRNTANGANGGVSVLDFGCGTGILGVAAALFGAASVTAVDIDPEAVRVTRELAARNGVSERVNASGRSLPDIVAIDSAFGVAFDLVFANVLIGVIEENGALLADAVAPGGHLVVSGIIESQRDRALHALAVHASVDLPDGGDVDLPAGDDVGLPARHGGVDVPVGVDAFVGSGLVLVSETKRDGWLRLVLGRPAPHSVIE